MSDVDLTIGGRIFKVACAEGEEAHVAGLGRMIDSKVAAVPGASGQSEGRMLLFASLMLADEVHDVQSRGAAANSETLSSSAAPAYDPALAEKLEAVAAALEKCASALEG